MSALGNRLAPVALLALSLSGGCVAAATSGARYTYDEAIIDRDMPAAQAGDPAAQYQVGNAYCCSAPTQLNPAKDNAKATEFLCKSARQNYAKAQYLLGRLYAGDLRGGFGPRAIAASLLFDRPKAEAVALVWLKRAADQGVSGAANKEAKVEATLSPDDKAKAYAWALNWQTAPCLWSDVFPSTPAK